MASSKLLRVFNPPAGQVMKSRQYWRIWWPSWQTLPVSSYITLDQKQMQTDGAWKRRCFKAQNAKVAWEFGACLSADQQSVRPWSQSKAVDASFGTCVIGGKCWILPFLQRPCATTWNQGQRLRTCFNWGTLWGRTANWWPLEAFVLQAKRWVMLKVFPFTSSQATCG